MRIYVPKESALKTWTLPRLDKFYWSLFSRWIRLKAAEPSTGMIECFCCGKLVHWKNADCAHFIPRRHASTRFNLINNHACCTICNRIKEGNLDAYAKRLERTYGKGTVDKLIYLKNLTIKINRNDYVQGILLLDKKLDAYEC